MVFWKSLIFIFLVFYGCAAFGGKKSNDLPESGPARIDPAIMADLEGLKSGGNPDRKIDVLIRTERELTAGERTALERNGAVISSSIGNVLSARVRLGSIKSISRLEFVTYIEKAKKQRLR
jgi:hypothetical protein